MKKTNLIAISLGLLLCSSSVVIAQKGTYATCKDFISRHRYMTAGIGIFTFLAYNIYKLNSIDSTGRNFFQNIVNDYQGKLTENIEHLEVPEFVEIFRDTNKFLPVYILSKIFKRPNNKCLIQFEEISPFSDKNNHPYTLNHLKDYELDLDENQITFEAILNAAPKVSAEILPAHFRKLASWDKKSQTISYN